MSSLLSLSGGIVYHLRSIKHSNKNWKSLFHNLSKHLDQWKPSHKEIVIIGSSGGYFLSKEFLKGFDKITCIDPDPLAKWIFKLRFQGLKIEWDYTDYISRRKFDLLKNTYPDACFLFSNILGQLSTILPNDVNVKNWINDFNQAFNKMEIFSFHERLSFELIPKDIEISSLSSLSNEDLIKLYLEAEEITVYDHHTDGVFPNFQKNYCVWKFSDSYFHLIEVVKKKQILT